MSAAIQTGMHFEFSEWPIVTIKQVGACTDAQVSAYLDDMRKLYDRNTYYAVVLDLREGIPFNSKQRKMQAEWLSASRDRVHHITGIAFVENSFLMRGAMQAAFWLNPPEYPYLVTKDLSEGQRWARAQFRMLARGVA